MSRAWFAWSIPSSWRDAVVEDLQQEAHACGRGSFWIAWQCLRTGTRMRLSLGGEEAAREIGYAVRSLGRARTFTATAVLTLALGIGANAVVFSIVESVLLRPFPYPDASDVVLLRGGRTPGSPSGISSSDLEQYRAQATAFSDLAVYSGVRLMSPDSAAPVAVAGVEDRVFRVLGVSPLLGQGLPPGPRLAPLPGESLLAFRDAEPKVVLLSHGFWRSRFGGDPAVVGRTLRLDSVPHEIVGVMPQGFFFPEPAVQLWRLPGPPTVRQLMAVGRLKPGGSIGTAQAEIDVISRRLDEALPPRATSSEGRRQAVLSPIRDAAVSRYHVVLWLLLGAVGLVLLIACANVANLLLARSVARAKELAIRASLGANRAGLIRQLVTESLLVATLGGILAVGLASVGVRLVLGLGLVDIPRMDSASINVPVLVFAAAVSVVTGLLAGVVPAVTASQVDLTGSLKQGGQTSSQSGHGRFRDALVVAEVGLAVLLLVGAGLLVRSFVALAQVEWGFSPENTSVVVVRPTQSFASLHDRPDQRRQFVDSVLERLRRFPGVVAAGAGTEVPLVRIGGGRGERVVADGAPVTASVSATRTVITPGYLRALGANVRGREFEAGDAALAPRGVVLSQRLARALFQNRDPIGRTVHFATLKGTRHSEGERPPRVSFDSIHAGGSESLEDFEVTGGTAHTVIGIADDMRMAGDPLADVAGPTVYVDYRQLQDRLSPQEQGFLAGFAMGGGAQNPGYLGGFVIRANGEARGVIDEARAAIREYDAGLSLLEAAPLRELLRRSVGGAGQSGLALALSSVFGVLSLLMAAAGIYGVMSHGVSQRVYEIGVRLTLGAEPRDIARMVLGHALRLAAAGLAIGLVGAWAGSRWLASMLFGIAPTDSATFVGVTLFLLAVAAAAAILPARRAARIDPLVAARAH